MHLLELCDNLVCRNHILLFLQVNDLLRLRRVCKVSKAQSEDFIRTQKVQTQRPLNVNLSNQVHFTRNNNFENVSYLPSRTNARISHCYYYKLKESRLDRFLVRNLIESWGCNVTHLTLLNLGISFYSKEILTFFQPFPNVTHLTLDVQCFIQQPIDNRRMMSRTNSAISKEINIPPSLQGLKMLKIFDPHPVWYFWENSHRYIISCITELLETCVPNLEQFSMPFEKFLLHGRVGIIRLACKCLFNAPNLKLKDVSWKFIKKLLKTNDRTPEMGSLNAMINILNAKVTSIHYFESQPRTFVLEFPNLEEVNWVGSYVILEPIEQKCELPKLKTIKITVDYETNSNTIWRLWRIFFGGIRGNVVNLDIEFDGYGYGYPEEILSGKSCRTRNIVEACPNLKTLKIRRTMNQLVSLPELWRGLTHLQELYLDGCDDLTNVDFIGMDLENPAFWALKNLKVLKLEYFGGELSNVTDDLFHQVLRHMPLKELYLVDRYSLRIQITLDGIKSLLTGTFATTIERLSIMDLHLEGVAMEDMEAVENLFRSSKMI